MSDVMDPNAVPPLPDALARRQIFHMLQRVSSYTAWKRYLGYYQRWVDIVETSLREADALGLGDKTSLPEDTYRDLLKALAHCDEGVRRLGRGDKRVFTYDDIHGAFAYAEMPVRFERERLNRFEEGELGLYPKFTPRFDEHVQALSILGAVWGELGIHVQERGRLQSDWPVDTYYNFYLAEELSRMHFPNPLPRVPVPSKPRLVRTGFTVPCSGIWEPVVAPKMGLRDWITLKSPEGPFVVDGTMAYLHGGTKARNKATDGPDGEPTTWLLLWEDTRYQDGVIPPGEQDYRFLEPSKRVPSWDFPGHTSSIPDFNARPAEPRIRLQAEAGSICPQTGNWLAPHLKSRREYIKQGEKMPGPQYTQTGGVMWYLMD